MPGHPLFMQVMTMTVTTITVHPSFPSRVMPSQHLHISYYKKKIIIFSKHQPKPNPNFRGCPRISFLQLHPIAFNSSPPFPSDAIPVPSEATDSHVMEFQIPSTSGHPRFLESCLNVIPLTALTNDQSPLSSMNVLDLSLSYLEPFQDLAIRLKHPTKSSEPKSSHCRPFHIIKNNYFSHQAATAIR